MERRKLFLIAVVLLLAWSLSGQKLTFYEVDTATYGMYLRGEWNELIKLSRKARRQGIDSYYLKLRTGYAYFQKGRYLKAIPYFEKAYRQNPDYEWTKEMLYYSYLYSGQDKAAMNMGMYLSYDNKIYQKLTENTLRSVDIAITRFNNLDYDRILSTDYQIGEYEYYFTRSQYSIDLGLYHQFSDNLFFYHDGQLLKQDRMWVVGTGPTNQAVATLNNTQIRSNGRLSYYLGRRFVANVNYNLIFGLVEKVGTFRGRLARYSTLFMDYSAGLSMEKQFSLFRVKTGIDFLKIGDTRDAYTNATLGFYPFANSNLYLATTVFYGLSSDVQQNTVIAPEISLRLGRLYLTGTYYYGTIYHLVTNDGYFVYNIDEPITSLYGATLTYTTKKNKTFFIGFYPSEYTFTIDDQQGTTTITQTANTNYIKGGVIWTF